MTQTELANLLKVKQSAVSKWTTGETLPERRTIRQICVHLNCSVEWLVTSARLHSLHLPSLELIHEKLDTIQATLEMLVKK